jgi:hypothetical protein
MLAALAASGQTPSAFARRIGVGLYRVSYWRARLGGDVAQPPRPRGGNFVAVRVRDERRVPDHHGSARDPRIEVTLVNGRRVAFAGNWDVAAIAPWLRALEVA